MAVPAELMPVSMREYNRAWLSTDVIAGVTLAAVAIPETMGYTSISQTPIVTGLYTVIFPTDLLRPAGRVQAPGRRRRLRHGGDPVGRAAEPQRPRADSRVLGVGGLLRSRRHRLRRHAVHRSAASSGIPGRLPVGVRADRLPHRSRHPGALRPDPQPARHPQGERQLVPAAVALDHVARRHLVGHVRLRRSHHRHHRGVQALPAQGARRDRRGRAAHHRLGADRRLVARCRGGRLREGRLPAHRAALGARVERRSSGARGLVLVLRPDHRPERGDVPELRHEAR